ncbi:MAG TPA: hypothetical protein VL309_05365 [Vicinamibacterales bacterium]|nr:hypothetical protein [Vicinamibacterales bacterium]
MSVWPATVTVLLRSLPVFGATPTTTEPFPRPDCPLVIASHGAPVEACQAQPSCVLTPTDSVPPTDDTESRAELKPNVQAAAAWLTVTRCEPTEIEALRETVVGFGATAYPTTASPWPLGVPVIDTHDVSAATDQPQSRLVAIVTAPGPPPGPKEEGALVRSTGHLPDDGAVTEVELD